MEKTRPIQSKRELEGPALSGANILCKASTQMGNTFEDQKKKCQNTIVSISWQNSIGKAALQLMEKQTI